MSTRDPRAFAINHTAAAVVYASGYHKKDGEVVYSPGLFSFNTRNFSKNLLKWLPEVTDEMIESQVQKIFGDAEDPQLEESIVSQSKALIYAILDAN